MAQQPAQALDDGQAQAGAAVIVMALAQAAELLEDLALQALGYAWALVVHLDAQLIAMAPAADQHLAAGRVADGIGEQVLQDAAQERLVAAHRVARAHAVQAQAAALGDDAEVVLHHQIGRAHV